VELEYSDKNSRRSKVYIGVGVIVALLVAATVYLALQANGLTGKEEVEMRSVVVAAREIPARKAIEEADVVIREVVADPTNEGAFGSLDQVLGRVAGIPVTSGQLISVSSLASTTEGSTFSILAPGEEYDAAGPDVRAVSLTVADANAVAGLLVPGQRVDLIVTMPINFIAGPSTKVTLQSVTILSRNGGVYIVRADLETAEKIAELQAVGGVFTMALRPEEDDRTADTEGSTVDRLIEEFGFPVPVPPPLGEPATADGN
jgi:pilus assembly protein CpaB